MIQDQALRRFAELLQAFVRLAERRCDLQLRGSALPPPLGFALRLQPGPTSAGVELALSVDGGTLSVWSGDGGRTPAGRERRVRLDLSAGYQWEALVFPSADHLARMLLYAMERALARGLARPPRLANGVERESGMRCTLAAKPSGLAREE